MGSFLGLVLFVEIIDFVVFREQKKKMSSLGTSKGILEIAKFGVYVTIPIVLMYTFANNTKNLHKFMGNVISLSLPLLWTIILCFENLFFLFMDHDLN